MKKIEKRGHTVLGRTMAHDLSLSAQPSQGYGPRRSDNVRTGHARGAVTACSACVVARWPAAWWSSAGDEVLPPSTRGGSGEALGKVRQSRAHTGLAG
jgi:hypothetical protein